ncbi:hypothetical protein VTO73DRAFT_1262 [Trametes versicolor]
MVSSPWMVGNGYCLYSYFSRNALCLPNSPTPRDAPLLPILALALAFLDRFVFFSSPLLVFRSCRAGSGIRFRGCSAASPATRTCTCTPPHRQWPPHAAAHQFHQTLSHRRLGAGLRWHSSSVPNTAHTPCHHRSYRAPVQCICTLPLTLSPQSAREGDGGRAVPAPRASRSDPLTYTQPNKTLWNELLRAAAHCTLTRGYTVRAY